MTDSNNNATPQFLTFSLPGGETRQTARPTSGWFSRRGATLTGNSVDVSVDMTNFGLVDALGKPGVARQGHTPYYLDMLPPPESGNSPVTTPGWFVPTINPTYNIWQNVSPGCTPSRSSW